MTAVAAAPVAAPAPARVREARRPRAFRPDIEGLRAVAVLLVVLYHAGWKALPGGFVGVDVFFVLSGFLITGHLAKEVRSTGSLSVAGFYARRARRILPGATAVVIATVILARLMLDPVRAASVATDGRWAAGFLANVHFLEVGTNYLNAGAPPSPLQHFWSLGVEEQFYVVWPVLLLIVAALLRRRPALAVRVIGVLAVVIAVVSLVYCVLATQHNATAAYFSPFTRAWELALGAALALAANRIARLPMVAASVLAWAGLAGIVVSALVYTDATRYPGSAAMLPVFSTVAVVAAGCAGATSAERLLALKPMQAIGGWSYSIYLWHWPALILVQGYVGKTLSTWENVVIVTGASMIAYTAYALLETPVRKAATLIREPSAALAMGLALILCSLGVTSAFINRQKVDVALEIAAGRGAQLSSLSVPGTSEVLADVAAAGSIHAATPSILSLAATAANDAESLAEEGCEAQDGDTTVGACVYGDKTGTKTMVLYGDSHAGMWEPSFDVLAKRVGWKLVVLSKSGCPVADISYYDFQSNNTNVNCTTWQKYAVGRINGLHPDLVVLTSAYYSTENADKSLVTPAQWQAGLTRTLSSITVPAADRVLLGDQAYLAADDPGGCIQQHKSDVQACSTPRSQAVPADKVAATKAAIAAVGGRYVDPLPWLCSATTCYPVVDGLAVYRNQFHLTATYATFLSGALGEALSLEKTR